MPQVKIKQPDWTEFDKWITGIVEKAANENTPIILIDELKDLKQQANPNGSTDAQRKMIIAIFTNELSWEPEHSFNFILKTIPAMKKRLGLTAVENHDLSKLYNKLSKKEASKLIDILKAISKRKPIV